MFFGSQLQILLIFIFILAPGVILLDDLTITLIKNGHSRTNLSPWIQVPHSEMGLVLISEFPNSTGKDNSVELTLLCKANVPVEWSFTGFLETSDEPLIFTNSTPTESLNPFNTTEVGIPETIGDFHSKIILKFRTQQIGSSAQVLCHSTRNFSSVASVTVFVPGSEKLLRLSSYIVYGEDDISVPCPVTDPRVNVTLTEVFKSDITVGSRNASYNPMYGFRIKKPSHLLRLKAFLCSANRIIRDFLASPDPEETSVYELRVSEEEIMSLCDGNHSFLDALIYQSGLHNPLAKFQQPLFRFRERFPYPLGNDTSSVSIHTRAKHLRLFCLIQERPQLFLRNRVAFVWELEVSNPPASVVNISSLARIKFPIPSPNIIMRRSQDVAYANETQEFQCVTKGYDTQFVPEMDFWRITMFLKKRDGRLEPTLGKSADCEVTNSTRINEMSLVALCNISTNVVGLLCIAPFVKYPQVFGGHEVHFETKYSYAPLIDKYRTPSKLTLKRGDVDKTIDCFADGEPKPIVNWVETSQCNIGSLTSGLRQIGSKLHVPIVSVFVTGKYTCIATNDVGVASVDVTVDVETGIQTWVVLLCVLGVFVIIIPIGVGVKVFVTRYKRQQQFLRNLTTEEIDLFFNGDLRMIGNQRDLRQETLEFIAYDQEREIDLEDTQFDYSKIIGTGQFAYVVRGLVKSSEREVAIKIAKPSADVNRFKSFLSEVKVMMYIGKNENVVEFVGACTKEIETRQVYIYLELCSVGSLDKFLRSKRSTFISLLNENQGIDPKPAYSQRITTQELVRWSKEIASGMEYLSSRMVVHADLATRNVLLDSELVAKVSDFGLSRRLYESQNYVKKSKTPMPWRWMAPEALTTLTFSTRTDVWSFAMTLWEIFTLGDIPFAEEVWDQSYVRRLTNGMRMGRPKYSNQEIYSKITCCWDMDPHFRPDFSELRKFFSNLLNSISDEATKSNLPGTNSNGGEPRITSTNIRGPTYANDYTPVSLNYLDQDSGVVYTA